MDEEVGVEKERAFFEERARSLKTQFPMDVDQCKVSAYALFLKMSLASCSPLQILWWRKENGPWLMEMIQSCIFQSSSPLCTFTELSRFILQLCNEQGAEWIDSFEECFLEDGCIHLFSSFPESFIRSGICSEVGLVNLPKHVSKREFVLGMKKRLTQKKTLSLRAILSVSKGAQFLDPPKKKEILFCILQQVQFLDEGLNKDTIESIEPLFAEVSKMDHETSKRCVNSNEAIHEKKTVQGCFCSILENHQEDHQKLPCNNSPQKHTSAKTKITPPPSSAMTTNTPSSSGALTVLRGHSYPHQHPHQRGRLSSLITIEGGPSSSSHYYPTSVYYSDLPLDECLLDEFIEGMNEIYHSGEENFF